MHVLVAAHATIGFSEAAKLFLHVLHFLTMIVVSFTLAREIKPRHQ